MTYSKKSSRHVFIIAEVGVNHNRSVVTAKKLIDAAKNAGADAVKFQTFIAEELVTEYAQKAEYQQRTAGKKESQLKMLKKLELNADAHTALIRHCRKKRIKFLSAPFDLRSIDLLSKLKIGIFKIPSGEITNLPYLAKIGRLRKEIILSTGMSNMEEIKRALNILIKAGTKKENITILHCNSEYPTPIKNVNLLAMATIRSVFGVKAGYSDHTLGIEVPIAAVALGAAVIEKHFTLDRAMKGPDHKASLEPHEFKEMVVAIRNIENALGDGIKKASFSELQNKAAVRKSIVAVREIKKGETFSEQNITAKRPGTGISPMEWDRIIGKVAKRPFKADELIEL